MTTILKTSAMIAVLAGAMLAQPRYRPMDANGTPPDPATMTANRVARLTTLLDLTTAQASQATTILTTEQSAVSSIQTTLDTDFTSLQTAIKSNAAGTIDSLASMIGALDGQLLAAHSKSEAALFAILTAAQQTKLDTLGGLGLLGGGGRGGPGGPGGPGGRGPRP